MGTVSVQALREQYPNYSDEDIAREIVESEGTYRFAIIYTNQFSHEDDYTDIGFGSLNEEYARYMTRPNARLLYEKGHVISQEDSRARARRLIKKLKENDSCVGFWGRLFGRKPQGPDPGADLIDQWRDLFRSGADYSEEGDRVRDNLVALNDKIVRKLLILSLDENEDINFRKSAIFLLLERIQAEEAIQPLFDRYVKGKDPEYLYLHEPEEFGLYREVKSGLKGMGFSTP